MPRSFPSLMEYLLKRDVITHQQDLAKMLKITEAGVSSMKRRGTIPDAYFQTIASFIFDESQKENALVSNADRATAVEKELEQLYRAVPSATSDRRNSKVGKGDFCYPCVSSFDEFVEGKEVSNIQFSDAIALNAKVIKGKGSCGNIVYMTYQKTNLDPVINRNDILVVKTTDKIEGEGYYVYKLEYDFKVDTLEACTRQNVDNTPSKLTADDIIGKVIGIYKKM